jgi:hypothetical protein
VENNPGQAGSVRAAHAPGLAGQALVLAAVRS